MFFAVVRFLPAYGCGSFIVIVHTLPGARGAAAYTIKRGSIVRTLPGRGQSPQTRSKDGSIVRTLPEERAVTAGLKKNVSFLDLDPEFLEAVAH